MLTHRIPQAVYQFRNIRLIRELCVCVCVPTNREATKGQDNLPIPSRPIPKFNHPTLSTNPQQLSQHTPEVLVIHQ